jgi:hypothetical protein
VLRLDGGVTVEELAHEAPALELSQDWQAFDMEAPETGAETLETGRVVPVMAPEDDGSENV